MPATPGCQRGTSAAGCRKPKTATCGTRRYRISRVWGRGSLLSETRKRGEQPQQPLGPAGVPNVAKERLIRDRPWHSQLLLPSRFRSALRKTRIRLGKDNRSASHITAAERVGGSFASCGQVIGYAEQLGTRYKTRYAQPFAAATKRCGGRYWIGRTLRVGGAICCADERLGWSAAMLTVPRQLVGVGWRALAPSIAAAGIDYGGVWTSGGVRPCGPTSKPAPRRRMRRVMRRDPGKTTAASPKRLGGRRRGGAPGRNAEEGLKRQKNCSKLGAPRKPAAGSRMARVGGLPPALTRVSRAGASYYGAAGRFVRSGTFITQPGCDPSSSLPIGAKGPINYSVGAVGRVGCLFWWDTSVVHHSSITITDR